MGRNIFGRWGISLDEGTFSRALAGWGVLRAAGVSPITPGLIFSELARLINLPDSDRLVSWWLTSEDLEEPNLPFSAQELADVWTQVTIGLTNQSPHFPFVGAR